MILRIKSMKIILKKKISKVMKKVFRFTRFIAMCIVGKRCIRFIILEKRNGRVNTQAVSNHGEKTGQNSASILRIRN